jgi:WD40 repeat protein
MSNPSEPQKLWKQLKLYEQRGDLAKQAEILEKALQTVIIPAQIQSVLQLTYQNAQAFAERHPEPVFLLDQDKHSLKWVHPQTGLPQKEALIPKEMGANAYVSWSAYGHLDLMILSIEDQKIKIIKEYGKLSPLQKALGLNGSYATLNVHDFNETMQSVFCHSWTMGQIPIEPVNSQPFDLFLSPRHPVLAVTDRGSGKLHLFQREHMRLTRSWKVVSRPSKKAISVIFHPDGKRIFSTSHEPNSLVLTDRAMAQKKIAVSGTYLLGNLAASPKGDTIILLGIHSDTHRPDLLILDTEKFQIQQVIPLEGEAFSSGADARDLLALSPDGRWAVVMVSKNQPALFTPCLLLVDLERGEILDRLILAADKKPINLAFLARQLVQPKFRLLPTLLHTQGISAEIIQSAFEIERLD